MNFKTHAYAGVVAATGISVATYYMTADNNASLICALVCFFASLFPDLDTDSIPARWTARVALAISLLSFFKEWYIPSSLIGMAFLLFKIGKHRGWTHKYSLIVVLCIVSFFHKEYQFIYYAVCFGLFTHYIVDGIRINKLKNWI